MGEREKWLATMRVAATNRMAYRIGFILLFIGPPIIFFLVKYNIWVSIYSLDGGVRIGGYTLSEMLSYQAYVMFITFLATSYNGVALSEDIRLGKISTHLLHPFSFRKYHTAHFLAFQCIQLSVAFFTLVVLILTGLVKTPDFSTLIFTVCYSFLISILWYNLQFLTGVFAFWLDKTWVFRVLLMIIGQFLSGAIFPLELFPQSFQKLLQYTFFPYMNFVPTKLLMGSYSGSLTQAISILLLWIILVRIVVNISWKRGLRLYTAAGV